MIRFFRASRMTAVWGSAVGAFAGAAAAWVFYPGDGGTKAVLALVAAALADSALVKVMPAFSFPRQGVYAVYPDAQHVPVRVRAFIDFLRERLG